MDFSWTDAQRELYDRVVDFARKALSKDVAQRDPPGTFPRDDWQKCAEFGLLGLCIPERYGGSGFDPLTTIHAMEALGYGCRDNGLAFALSAQMWSVQAPVLRFGSEAQRAEVLPRLVSGEWIGAHGMTEPDSGSDALSLRTKARQDGDDYVLDGTKTFVSNAPLADVFVVFARTHPTRKVLAISAFLVPRDTPGLGVGRPIEKLGLRTAPMSEVVFDGCRVPGSARLGGEGNGSVIFGHSMTWERSCILASCVGTMERQLEETIAYARGRQQFGRSITSFQAVSHRIVDAKVRLESARLMLYRAGYALGRDEDATAYAAMAKLAVAEAFVASSLDVLQIHGGYGYATEYGVERDVRDAIGSRIYSGTSDIQKELIARALGLHREERR